MNSSLGSQNSMPGQKVQGRSRFKVAVFCVLTVHVVGLLALLLQGCKREQTQLPPEVVTDTNLAPIAEASMTAMPPETNAVQPEPPPVQPLAPTAHEHVIVKGDTLSDIAKKYSVTLAALKAANPNVDERKLQIGHKLVIPAPEAAPVSAPVGQPVASETGETIHAVKSGDTLAAIAKKYGVTWQAIQDANNLPTTKIVVGQKLKIPAKAGSTAPTQ